MEAYAALQRGGGGRAAPLPTGVRAEPLAGFNTWAMTINHQAPNLTNMITISDTVASLRSDGFGPLQFIDADAIVGRGIRIRFRNVPNAVMI